MTGSKKYTPRFPRRIFMQKSPKKAHFWFQIGSKSQKKGENQAIFPLFSGAGGRARTDTNSRSRDFKSLASANSTTPAHFLYEICIYSFFVLTQRILSPLRLPIPPHRRIIQFAFCPRLARIQSKGLKISGLPKKDAVFFREEEP